MESNYGGKGSGGSKHALPGGNGAGRGIGGVKGFGYGSGSGMGGQIVELSQFKRTNGHGDGHGSGCGSGYMG